MIVPLCFFHVRNGERGLSGRFGCRFQQEKTPGKTGGREKTFGKILGQVLREILRRVISLKRRMIWLVCQSQNEGYGGIFQHLFYGFARIAPFGACGNCPFLRHFLFQTVYFPPVFPPLRKERRFFCCMKTPRPLFPWPPYHKLSCIEQMGSADISRLSAKPPRDRFREVRTRRGRGRDKKQPPKQGAGWQEKAGGYPGGFVSPL